MSIGPDRDEIRMRVECSPNIGVVHSAAVGHLKHPGPGGSLVGAFPHRNLAARIAGLWPWFGGPDDTPVIVSHHPEFTHVIVVVGSCDR